MIDTYELVFNSMGIYPSSINGIPRTEFQRGWNGYAKEFIHRVVRLEVWYRRLPENIQLYILDLKDFIDFDLSSEQIDLYVVCNEVFCFGCADAEKIKLSELASLKLELERDPLYGAIKWCCFKRHELPQPAIIEDMKNSGAWCSKMEKLYADNQPLRV